jgi:uncharacterized protein YdeI (YjbR/CyaY-like superfamily)
MDISGEQLHLIDRQQWRDWLSQKHATTREVWLVFYKKHTGKPCIPYDEAVQEALCFGWIDGLLNRIDKDRYRVRFSPRKSGSIWAESNKKRVEQMIRQGRMTEAGLARVEEAKRSGEWEQARVRDNPDTPQDLLEALQSDSGAASDFERLAPSHRKNFIWWINSAKKPETRAKRIRETVRMVRQRQHLGSA